ncbi:MAG: hypothetical protein ACD_84C00039G0008 [uncultured bacterium]|nr:MAG: hypothetical protein ACD_84C00039G0008 [uncultured bacterium]
MCDTRMLTVAESSALVPDVKLAMLQNAKPGTWYDDWKPYCGTCSTMQRMVKHEYGFRCAGCGNMIGWDLTRLVESPLNDKKHIVKSATSTRVSRSCSNYAFK